MRARSASLASGGSGCVSVKLWNWLTSTSNGWRSCTNARHDRGFRGPELHQL
jgi:hypothetical protein